MEAQTIRDVLRRKKRWALLLLVVGWLSSAIWTFQDDKSASVSPYLLGALGLVFALGAIFLAFFIRCPRCRGNVGSLNAGVSKVVPFYTVINYCPYCGVSLDSPIEP